jgi:hypothetical protein
MLRLHWMRTVMGSAAFTANSLALGTVMDKQLNLLVVA